MKNKQFKQMVLKKKAKSVMVLTLAGTLCVPNSVFAEASYTDEVEIIEKMDNINETMELDIESDTNDVIIDDAIILDEFEESLMDNTDLDDEIIDVEDEYVETDIPLDNNDELSDITNSTDENENAELNTDTSLNNDFMLEKVNDLQKDVTENVDVAVQSQTEPTVETDVNVQPEVVEEEVAQYLSTTTTTTVKTGIWTSDIEDVTYTGSAMKPSISVYDGSALLVEGTDYTLSYKNNTKVNITGSGTKAPQVVVKMKGKYKGTYTTYFKIQPMDISSNDFVANDVVAKYTGKKLTPKPTLMWNGKTLKYGTDYTVEDYSTKTFTDAGTYTLTLVGKNNFTGKKSITLTISDNKNQIDMSKITIKGISSKGYTGSQITQTPSSVKYKKDTLVEGVDYTVSYGVNVNIGVGTITFTGTGTDGDNDGLSYLGSKTVTFKITGGNLSKAKVNDIKKQYDYTGEAITPTATLTYDSATLKEGVDYTVSYQSNKSKGTGTIIFTGLNGFTGTKKQTFKIVAGSLSKATVSIKNGSSVVYTGSKITPAVEVTVDSKVLELGVDYTVSYKNNVKEASSTSNKAPSIIIKGKGNYSGSQTITFSIVSEDNKDVEDNNTNNDKNDNTDNNENTGSTTTPDTTVKDDTTTTTPDYVGDTYQEQLLKEINEYRVANGLKALTLHSSLTASAMIRAEELSESFLPTRPNDEYAASTVVTVPWHVFKEIIVKCSTNSSVLESVKTDDFDVEELLSPKVFECGIGYYIVNDTRYVSLILCDLI